MRNGIVFLIIHAISSYSVYAMITISQDQAKAIGKKIWHNESRGTIEGLTCWNEGEEFSSLGIGHFIWYPNHQKKLFKDSFPSLIKYFIEHDVSVPRWLVKAIHNGCPWKTRTEFLAAQDSAKMRALRKLLVDTVDLQTKFMILRLEKIMCTKKLHPIKLIRIKKQMHRMITSDKGIYALIDYLNFKGEGLKSSEYYNGTGWGLVQVLDKMQGTASGKSATQEFANTALLLLNQRIKNAPAQRNEARWLPGWINRIKTYI
jgi:hypothetical protein